MKLDVVGMEDLMNEFARMEGPELNKLEREAVKAGAKPIQQAQEKLWNKSANRGEHIKDEIRTGRPYETEEGTEINVGPKIGLRWRAKFVEYGTSKQPPQSPVEKSGQIAEAQATREMMKVLERVVK